MSIPSLNNMIMAVLVTPETEQLGRVASLLDPVQSVEECEQYREVQCNECQ
jgi:hypothetical protein